MGIARVGPRGQIVLPKAVRDAAGIAPGDRVVVAVDQGTVVVRPWRVRSSPDLVGVLHGGGAFDVHAARRHYQEHLAEKLHPSRPDA